MVCIRAHQCAGHPKTATQMLYSAVAPMHAAVTRGSSSISNKLHCFAKNVQAPPSDPGPAGSYVKERRGQQGHSSDQILCMSR